MKYSASIEKLFILSLTFHKKQFFRTCSVKETQFKIFYANSHSYLTFFVKNFILFMQNISQILFDKIFLHLHFIVLSIKFIHNLLLIYWQVFFFWLIYITEKNVEAHVKNGEMQNIFPDLENIPRFPMRKKLSLKIWIFTSPHFHFHFHVNEKEKWKN